MMTVGQFHPSWRSLQKFGWCCTPLGCLVYLQEALFQKSMFIRPKALIHCEFNGDKLKLWQGVNLKFRMDKFRICIQQNITCQCKQGPEIVFQRTLLRCETSTWFRQNGRMLTLWSNLHLNMLFWWPMLIFAPKNFEFGVKKSRKNICPMKIKTECDRASNFLGCYRTLLLLDRSFNIVKFGICPFSRITTT